MAELVLQFNANVTSASNDLHLVGLSFLWSRTHRKISFTLRIFLSASPLPWEWYAEERRFSVPNSSHNFYIISPSTFDPWSLNRNDGTPWIKSQYDERAFDIEAASWSRKATVCIYFEKRSPIRRKYR